MIDDLDEALRKLLVREIPIKNGEVEIEFKQPTRQWSARLSRPTLNIYLYDLRENTKLRRTEPDWEVRRGNNGNSGGFRRLNPVRVDLHYLLTAWASEPDDEHRLLARTLMALYRFPELPADILPTSLQKQPEAIVLQVGQYDMLEKPSDFWNVMDNQQRPGIVCMVTLALDPYTPFTAPLIRTLELRYGQTTDGESRTLIEEAGRDTSVHISGQVLSKQPLKDLRVSVVERAYEVKVRPEGKYLISNIQPGEYTLEIAAEGLTPQQHRIKVPAANYDVEIK